MTDEEAKELLQQNRLLAEKLANGSEKKKDFWDKLSSLLTALAGPLISLAIAIVGWHFTNAYNDRQSESTKSYNDRQLQTTSSYNQGQLRLAAATAVAPFMPYITGKDPAAKDYAVLVISRFDAELGLQLGKAYKSKRALAALAMTGQVGTQRLAFQALRELAGGATAGGGAPSAAAGNPPTEKGQPSGEVAVGPGGSRAGSGGPRNAAGNPPREGVQPNGDFAVHAGEVVTVTVTVEGTTPIVAWSDLGFGNWVVDSPLRRTFVVPSAPSNYFTLLFQFSEKEGGRYHIHIEWGKDSRFDQDVVQDVSQLPASRTYIFTVIGQ